MTICDSQDGPPGSAEAEEGGSGQQTSSSVGDGAVDGPWTNNSSVGIMTSQHHPALTLSSLDLLLNLFVP